MQSIGGIQYFETDKTQGTWAQRMSEVSLRFEMQIFDMTAPMYCERQRIYSHLQGSSPTQHRVRKLFQYPPVPVA